MSMFGYLLLETNSSEEYGEVFYGFVSSFEASLYFIVNLLKIKSVLKLMKQFEVFIEMSKLSGFI